MWDSVLRCTSGDMLNLKNPLLLWKVAPVQLQAEWYWNASIYPFSQKRGNRKSSPSVSTYKIQLQSVWVWVWVVSHSGINYATEHSRKTNIISTVVALPVTYYHPAVALISPSSSSRMDHLDKRLDRWTHIVHNIFKVHSVHRVHPRGLYLVFFYKKKHLLLKTNLISSAFIESKSFTDLQQ